MTHEQMIEAMSGELRPGFVLPNGWTVIDHRTNPNNTDCAVVLAVSAGDPDRVHPFATWIAFNRDGEWDTQWGEYLFNLDAARASLADRSPW